MAERECQYTWEEGQNPLCKGERHPYVRTVRGKLFLRNLCDGHWALARDRDQATLERLTPEEADVFEIMAR